MTNVNDLIARREAILPRGIPMVSRATVDRASGSTLRDAAGNEWIDFAGGIGVMNVGHCHPAVVQAIQDQAAKLLHTCIHVATYEPYVALCERLAGLLPHGPATRVMLVNSGAEAVENAVKIARQATGRPALICFTESFHGRTFMAMSLTSKVGYKTGCGPFAPEVYRLPFPNRYRYGDGLDEAGFVRRELKRLRDTLSNRVAAADVAGIILETVQGEGGFVPVPGDYLRGLREICDETGILLILDEVQTGFFRTGRWAAYEHFGVTPDISTWAKSLGGGMPIAAVMGKADVMDAARPGTIGGTYGGNPVACAAALASLQVMEDMQLGRRADATGHRILARLQQLQREFPQWVGDVRGLGAMVGLELVEHGDPMRPASAFTRQVLQGCQDRGLLIIGAGLYGNVIRFLAPLTISDELVDRGLDILEQEFRSAVENCLPTSEASAT